MRQLPSRRRAVGRSGSEGRLLIDQLCVCVSVYHQPTLSCCFVPSWLSLFLGSLRPRHQCGRTDGAQCVLSVAARRGGGGSVVVPALQRRLSERRVSQ